MIVIAIIHRIGTPENDSESKAIKRLAKELSNDCFVFHNFEVTTGRGLPYETGRLCGGRTTHGALNSREQRRGEMTKARGNEEMWTPSGVGCWTFIACLLVVIAFTFNGDYTGGLFAAFLIAVLVLVVGLFSSFVKLIWRRNDRS